MDIDLKQIKELMRAMRQFEMSELEIESDAGRIRLGRPNDNAGMTSNVMMPAYMPGIAGMGTPSSVPPPPDSDRSAAPVSAPADDPNMAYITSPFVGTFYRAPGPDAKNFVEVGDNIKPGQTLCIVEAMKLMNHIESEIGGQIVEVLIENGQVVEYGDRLFKVRKG